VCLANKSSFAVGSAEANVSAIARRFSEAGGVFVTPAPAVATRLRRVRAVVFDWDGVFNSGVKGQGQPSTFSEADSMGSNMLRYALWRQAKRLPVVAVVSGEENRVALQFAKRERFQAVYSGVRDKRLVIEHLCSRHKLETDEVVCVFDDINDLGMAALCGVRYLVRRAASPLLTRYVLEHELCDYISANEPSQYAVRELCELSLGLMGMFDPVVDSRVAYDASYQHYFTQRQAGRTHCYTQKARKLVSLRTRQK
jgi:3-deoxy-D-manno-octulosonate 8-phosphate phosphatase (KDO 8-P phosphatase)